jgi:putative holliday junction resolvase
MRLLGVDFGGKRIGIAVGEAEHKVASPRSAISASGTLRVDAEAIAKIARDETALQVVLGIPLDENGEETKMSRICRKLGDEISKVGFEVAYVDESMTSLASHSALREHDMTAAQRRRHVDSEAACQILERYWSA